MNNWFKEEKCADIVESEVEKNVCKKYNINLNEIIKREHEYWKNRCVLQERGRILEKLNAAHGDGRYNDEIDECIDEIMALDKVEGKYSEDNIKLIGSNTIQCSRLARRRTGQTSIMFENPDGTLCWMSYSESKASKEEKIDYYSKEYLAKSDEIHKDRIEAAKKKQEMEVKKPYAERLEDHANILDKANRRLEDSEEISNLLDYWKICKLSQLFAGVEGDTITCFKADLNKIKKAGVDKVKVDTNADTILVPDELQRVMEEVNKLRNDKPKAKYEDEVKAKRANNICSCGRGPIGYIIQNTKRVCLNCAKESKIKMSFKCAKGPHIVDNAKYAIIGDDNEVYCEEHV